MFVQTQEVDVPIINEIKQEGISSQAASIKLVASIHYIQQMIVSINSKPSLRCVMTVSNLPHFVATKLNRLKHRTSTVL